MAPLLTPGLQFYIDQGFTELEGGPRRNELYVVCKYGFINSVHDPKRPINWQLVERGNEFWLRVNQEIKQCTIRYHSRVDPPQFAEITEQKDTGDEISSIAKIDPLLAQCAVMLNDPVQTAAMAKFAEGKMSYFEMRSLCG